MLRKFGLVETRAKAVGVGDRYGRLTVTDVGQVPDTYRYYAVCDCDCGEKEVVVRFDGLLSGFSQSCGCLQKERTTTHGLSSSIHYGRWRHMMERCYDPECVAYPDYGGRGIKVCERWHDLATFIEEIAPGFFPGAEMDRIDNDGDYEPGNVRWVTRRLNTDNRRSGNRIRFRGKTKSLTRWAEETGINYGTLWTRIMENGWLPKEALTTPTRPYERMVTYNGKTQSVSAWARETGFHVSTLMNRLQSGWSDEDVVTAPRGTRKKQRPASNYYTFDGEQRTIREIAQITGIREKLLRKRINRHWSIERATRDRTDL